MTRIPIGSRVIMKDTGKICTIINFCPYTPSHGGRCYEVQNKDKKISHEFDSYFVIIYQPKGE